MGRSGDLQQVPRALGLGEKHAGERKQPPRDGGAFADRAARQPRPTSASYGRPGAVPANISVQLGFGTTPHY